MSTSGTMVPRHNLKPFNVLCGGTTGATAFRLNQDNVKEVAALERSDVASMVFPNRDQVCDAHRFCAGRPAKLDQLPFHTFTSAEGDQPFGHGARP